MVADRSITSPDFSEIRWADRLEAERQRVPAARLVENQIESSEFMMIRIPPASGSREGTLIPAAIHYVQA
jgi:hypothetical protein